MPNVKSGHTPTPFISAAIYNQAEIDEIRNNLKKFKIVVIQDKKGGNVQKASK